MTKKLLSSKIIPAALKSRNYRLFFIGQGISRIGTWMTNVATVWLVYQLTHSALMLGIVGFISQIPCFFLSPFAGVILDRCNIQKLLILTQKLAMLQSLILAILTLSNAINIWYIVGLSLFQGLIDAFDSPTRDTFIKDVVDKQEDLPNAIALNFVLVTGARLIGPAIAGIIIVSLGSGYCFLIDAISYVAVILALSSIKLQIQTRSTQKTNFWKQFKEGFTYTFASAHIRAILQVLALFSLFAMPYPTIVPIFASEILHGDASTLGFLTAAAGLGALLGGIYLNIRPIELHSEKLMVFTTAICGVALIAFGISNVLWFSLLMSLLIGFSGILEIASSNTKLQTIVENDKRGRVMSLFTVTFVGIQPFGDLLIGSLAHKIGAPNTLIICGSFCLIGAFLFAKYFPRSSNDNCGQQQ